MAASDKSVVVSSTDFSSDSSVSDGWQELTKSDYAKVIFSDLLYNAASGTVECKFQITDSVHEDPSDFVGLFRIGYEDLSQCLVSKMLSQTKCEDDGKLQRCVFTYNELPVLDDGFYQFLYVTRDQEVCGASMPFQIKMSPPQPKESCSTSESMDAGFLLVSNEMERRVKEEPQEKVSAQQSALSEQKKEEIAAWVSQNPDYYSLIEQIREHTFTIDALQQSKDLAMREVAQLYEHLNMQNVELVQLKNMLAAYEEKIKMSQCLQDEKTEELIQRKSMLAFYEGKMLKAQEQKDAAITEMRESMTAYEEKIKSYELLQKEKEEELSRVKSEFLLQEEKLKTSLVFQDEQQAKISNLKRELEEMKEKERLQVTAEAERGSMDSVIQKAQDLVHVVSDAIKNVDFTVEEEVEKFFNLKIQLLIILSKMTRATDLANLCDENGLHKTSQSPVKQDKKGSSSAGPSSCVLENRDPVQTIALNESTPREEKIDTATSSVETPSSPGPSEKKTASSAGPSSCVLENRDPVQTFALNENTPKDEKIDTPTSSVETPSSPDPSEKKTASEEASKEVGQRISLNKASESEILEHQIIELPRLDVINEDTAKILQTDVEAITVINRLTENIVRRGLNLYEAIELIDDSVSDSGSDASEISECCLSLRKDIICVSKIMEALSSYLHNQTSLDHLIVVEKEEDKHLIHRNKWDVLLQKCALRYQFELLLEHIERQKEGTKKVSEKICDLLTKCMLLTDEVGESKVTCGRLQSLLDQKEVQISRLKGELEFKNTLVSHFRSQKEELEKTVEDFHARLVKASDLYKMLYRKRERLSKKLQKYESVKDKTNTSKNGESSQSSLESSNTASSFEVVKEESIQNINDNDTGEHMFGKASLISKEDTQLQIDELKAVPERCPTPPTSPFSDVLPPNPELKSVEKTDSECQSNQTAAVFTDFASYEQFQEVIKESFTCLKKPEASRNLPECSISCFMCKRIVDLNPETPVDLINHLETEHSMKMCPVCGQLFEDAIPPRYFHIHVEQHFQTE